MKIFSFILILLMGITSVSAATPSPRYLANQERIRIMKLMKTITISVLPGTYIVTVTDNDVIITPYEDTTVVEPVPVIAPITIETDTGTTSDGYDYATPVPPIVLAPPIIKTMLPPVDDGLHCGRHGCGEQ